jgi:hypothetical protein
MFVNLNYLHVYDSEFDDEKADEDRFEEPWVVHMCRLMTPSEITLKVNHFCSKKMMYNKYYNTKEAKILMTTFGYPKHKQKTLEFAQ